MAEIWREGDVDEIDDAEFSTDSARLVSGQFVICGRLDWQQSLALIEPDTVHNSGWRRGMRRRYGDGIRLITTPVRLTIDGATDFRVIDEAGTGVLIFERIVNEPEDVMLVGVIPCRISIRAPTARRVRILIGTPDVPASR